MKKIITLTIIGAVFLSFIIYQCFYHERVQIVALGDGIATGETYYDVTGYSFNDYLRDYFEETKKIDEYIKEFADKKETSETLKMKLANNYVLESTDTKIQQALHEASFITIAIGTYELNHPKLTTKEINNYLKNMNKIISLLRVYNDKTIVLLSLYPFRYLEKEEVKEINESLKNLCTEKNIYFVDITDIVNNNAYFFNKDTPYPNYKGHRYIKDEIVKAVFD